MSYYTSSDTSWWTLVICIVLVVLIAIGFNTCTASKWNGGECPDCHKDYELRAVNDGFRYYACPDCGEEVTRYGRR